MLETSAAISVPGMFSVLQFGVLVPPLSPWQGKSHPPALVLPAVADDAPRNPVSAVEGAIDQALASCASPAILFSGGVDSGLIAARSRHLGQDPLLVNYAFGPDDEDSRHAERMAGHLGLRFRRVVASGKALRCLDAPGSIYPSPFGDFSTPAFAELAEASVEGLPADAVVFDGTGADGGFGLAARTATWLKLYRIPSMLRRLAGAGYGRHWLNAASHRERWAGPLRRSAQMQFPAAALAQNALAGIAYDESPQAQVLAMLADYLKPWSHEPALAYIAGDLALVCAGTYAQRAGPLYRRFGVRVVYPFLTDRSVALAFAIGRGGAAKELLKEALAKHVPRELVYRSKVGFTPPQEAVFHHPVFLEHLGATTSGRLSAILDHRVIAEATNALHKGGRVPTQTANFLWAATFLDRWLRTAVTPAPAPYEPGSHRSS